MKSAKFTSHPLELPVALLALLTLGLAAPFNVKKTPPPGLILPTLGAVETIQAPPDKEEDNIQLEKISTPPAPPKRDLAKRELSKKRLLHAQELLGNGYRTSPVKKTEHIQNMTPYIKSWISRSIVGRRWKPKANKIARAILHESQKYGFDPIFLMAVIENESSFNPEAKGLHGEIGLMQLMPSTAKWVADKHKIKWHGPETMADPISNIKIGTAYLNDLKNSFDSHGRLYLSAYNMGSRKVRKSIRKNVWPKQYVSRVMQRYIRFYEELVQII